MSRLLMPHNKSNSLHNGGFTIIELLIATSVFSVILLVLTAGIIQIGRVYYKGITSAQTQATARSIIDAVSQDIQFSGGAVAPNIISGAYSAQCVGSRVYQFQPGVIYSGTGQGVTAGTLTTGGCTSGLTLIAATNDTSQMLGVRMRVANFSIVSLPTAGLYKVTVRVVSGEDDLLCSPAGLNNCSNATMLTATEKNNTDLQCKNIRAGSQYCAVSELSTVVERRISS